MKKSHIMKIPLFVIIFTAIILLMNYSNIDFNINSMFKIKNINEAMADLDNATNEVNRLHQELFESEDKIQMLKQNLDNMIIEILETDSYIDEFKIICGRTDVRGPGITVRVADNLTDDFYDVNDKIVHDFDVRMIINDLNSAGAEAISINGKRIVNTTEVICVGPVIRVNGEAVAAPFIIKAIGDSDALMEEAIVSVDSYAYDIQNNYGIDITAIKSNDINISKNREKIEVKYAKLYEEGE